jgi:hypothetical protein
MVTCIFVSAIQDRVVLDNIAGSFWVSLLIMLPVGPVVGKPGLPGSFQTGLPVLADLLPAAGVLVVRGHITHPGVQPHRVPMNL